MHDALTGLPNRRQFEAWLQALLTGPEAARMALLFLDLNGFKPINDRYGHAVGDAALRRIADLLRQLLPEQFRIARLGGDEFVVLALELEHPEAQLAWTARKLHLALETPQPLAAGLALPLSVSTGAAVHAPGLSRADWLARADQAMYAAKAAGPNQFRLFAEDADDGSAVA